MSLSSSGLASPAKLVEVGVDWLTLTSHDPHRGGEWYDTFCEIAEFARGEGYLDEASTWLGYTGHKVGRLFVGARSDGWIVRLSSDWAERYGGLFFPDAVRCTRIDLAVTTWQQGEPGVQLGRLWSALQASEKRKTRASTCKLWSDAFGPQGISLGSRSSERYSRIYDKGKESGDDYYRGSLRWEVEIKGDLASQAALLVYSAENRRRAIRDVVADHFRCRGCATPFASAGEYTLAPARNQEAEVFVKLKWLREGVSPTVRRLVDACGLERVLDALFDKTSGYLDRGAILEWLARDDPS